MCDVARESLISVHPRPVDEARDGPKVMHVSADASRDHSRDHDEIHPSGKGLPSKDNEDDSGHTDQPRYRQCKANPEDGLDGE